jgi:pyrophosphatase PpaX
MQSFRHAFKKHLNKDIEDSEIIKLFGEPLEYSMKKYDTDNTDTLIKYFREFNESKHDELASGFLGVDSALRGLKELGIKIAVVTSKRKLMAIRGLKLINIQEYIDILVTPEDTSKHKPNPEPALKACETLGIKPEEAIMVGDSIYDIMCGKDAGCSTCAVTYSEFGLDELLECKPDYVIDSLEKLLDIINDESGEQVV